MKKILIFSTAYYPFVGGAEIAVKEITDRIDQSDIEFYMVTLKMSAKLPKYEKIGNVHVYRVGGNNKYLFIYLALRKALGLHKKHKFNAIWSIMASYAGFAALFFKYLKSDIPFMLTLQEGDPFSYIIKRVGIFYPLFKQIFKKADVVYAISNYLADFGKRMGHNKKIYVIPNGVDVSIFTKSYSKQELGVLQWNLHKQTNDIFLITTSRLVEKNGLADVIRALTFLPTTVKFLILGVGELELSLKDLAKQIGVENRVMFIGFVDYKNIPSYLKIADIFIRPSLSEGMGNSFIEAMAAGVPVIATPVGGIPDFLEDGKTGVFCKINDSESIANAVDKIIKDERFRNNIILQAKNMVTERFDWSYIAKSVRNIFPLI